MLYLILMMALPFLLVAIFGAVRGIVLFTGLALLVIFERRVAMRRKTAQLEFAPCIIQLYVLLLAIFISVQVVGPDIVMVFCGGSLVAFSVVGYIKGLTEDPQHHTENSSLGLS